MVEKSVRCPIVELAGFPLVEPERAESAEGVLYDSGVSGVGAGADVE